VEDKPDATPLSINGRTDGSFNGKNGSAGTCHTLKVGLRHLYNNSPAGVLLQRRMRKAQALPESGQQVAQAGWQVGYQYPNNFSLAFTRHFGRSPKTIFGNPCG